MSHQTITGHRNSTNSAKIKVIYGVFNEVNKISYHKISYEEEIATVSSQSLSDAKVIGQISLHSVTNCFPFQRVLNCSGKACSDCKKDNRKKTGQQTSKTNKNQEW